MNSQTEQIYKSFNRQLQMELAERHPDLRPVLAEIMRAESKQTRWLADWGNCPATNNNAMADIKEQIESELTTRQVMEYYGIHFNRRGFALCPFHAEKTASLSIKNNHFKCFGCGASGDLFDFVAEMFGISFTESIKKLCGDFSIGPATVVTDRKERAKRIRADRVAHEEFRQRYLDKVDLFRFLYTSIRKYRPTDEGPDTWHPLYVYSVHRIGQIRAWLDEHANAYTNITTWREVRPDDDSRIN